MQWSGKLRDWSVYGTYQPWTQSQMSNTPFTRYNRLWNRLYNRFDNQLYRVNKHPSGCETGSQTGLTTVLNEQPLFVQPVVKPRCTTGLTTGCIHDTAVCQTGCQTGLTTGCVVYTNIYSVTDLTTGCIVCKRGLTEVGWRHPHQSSPWRRPWSVCVAWMIAWKVVDPMPTGYVDR